MKPAEYADQSPDYSGPKHLDTYVNADHTFDITNCPNAGLDVKVYTVSLKPRKFCCPVCSLVLRAPSNSSGVSYHPTPDMPYPKNPSKAVMFNPLKKDEPELSDTDSVADEDLDEITNLAEDSRMMDELLDSSKSPLHALTELNPSVTNTAATTEKAESTEPKPVESRHELPPLDGDRLDHRTAKAALRGAGAKMTFCGVQRRIVHIYAERDERLALNRNTLMHNQPIVLETLRPTYWAKVGFYTALLTVLWVIQYIVLAWWTRNCKRPISIEPYIGESPFVLPYLFFKSLGWFRGSFVATGYYHAVSGINGMLDSMAGGFERWTGESSSHSTFDPSFLRNLGAEQNYTSVCFEGRLMYLFWALFFLIPPAILALRLVKHLRVRVTYSPHALACMMAEYTRGTNAEVVRNTATMRYARLSSLPIVDSLSTIVMHGTIICCEALVRTQSFFTQGAALLRQPCSTPTLPLGKCTQKAHVLLSCPYQNLQPDWWNLAKRSSLRPGNVAFVVACSVASIMVLYVVTRQFVATQTILRLLSMA
jgi:hypothetical protein